MRHLYCNFSEIEQNSYDGTKNIMIVDDEKTFHQLFVDILKASHPHFNVLGAQNGKKAIETSESGPVDIVVADLRMSEMNGFEVLVYLNSRFPSILTIVMSAFWTLELKEKLRALGTFRFLSKPFDFSERLNGISESLKRDSKVGFVKGIHRTILLKKRPIQ